MVVEGIVKNVTALNLLFIPFNFILLIKIHNMTVCQSIETWGIL